MAVTVYPQYQPFGTTIASLGNGEGLEKFAGFLKTVIDAALKVFEEIDNEPLRAFAGVMGAAKSAVESFNACDRIKAWVCDEVVKKRDVNDLNEDQKLAVKITSIASAVFLTATHFVETLKAWDLVDFGALGASLGEAFPVLRLLEPFSPLRLFQNGCLIISTSISLGKEIYLLVINYGKLNALNVTASRVDEIRATVLQGTGQNPVPISQDEYKALELSEKISKQWISIGADTVKLSAIVVSTAILVYGGPALRVFEIGLGVLSKSTGIVKFLAKDALFPKFNLVAAAA